MFVDFNCYVDDNSLSECTNPSGLTTSIYSCTSDRVIGVQCTRMCLISYYYISLQIYINIEPCQEKDVRLVGGDRYGRVELCSNGEWVSICSDQFWDDTDAGVLCRQLGFSQYGKIRVVYNVMSWLCCVLLRLRVLLCWYDHTHAYSTYTSIASGLDLHMQFIAGVFSWEKSCVLYTYICHKWTDFTYTTFNRSFLCFLLCSDLL